MFPIGALEINVRGITAGAVTDVTLSFDTPVSTVQKLLGSGWGSFEFDGVTGARLSADGRSVVLSLQDGGRGDSDGAANGRVADPVSPAAAIGSELVQRIPPQQTLGQAREQMSGEKFATFDFPARACMGVYVHEIFIPTKYAPLAGDVRQNLLDIFSLAITAGSVTPYGHGDDRQQSRDFAPDRTRAYIVLDFQNGFGWVVSNKSMAKYLNANGQEVFTNSFDARQVQVQWGDGANSWIGADWVTPDVFRVRYKLQSSGPGTSVILPSIDHQILINRLTGAVTIEGDKYPSTGTYVYPRKIAGSTETVRLVSSQNGVNLNDLGGNPTFSYPQRAVGAQPGNGCPYTGIGRLSNCYPQSNPSPLDTSSLRIWSFGGATSNASVHFNSDCSGTTPRRTVVSASGPAQANALCQSLLGSRVFAFAIDSTWPGTPFNYGCEYTSV